MSRPTINTPPIVDLTIAATLERPAVTIKTILNATVGVYANAAVTVTHPVVAVTPTLIAKMRLGALRRDALRVALGAHNEELASRPAVKSYFRGSTGRAVSEKARLDPSAEQLENAALIYRLARLAGDFPVQAIARSFNLEHPDAQRWAALARKNGDLR